MIDTIKGFPPCPMCFELLSLRSMPGLNETHWHCKHCGTQWATPDLIQALNDNFILVEEDEDE